MAEGKVTSLADIVYERVEEDILTGAYQRGDVLTELKLSEKLNVSRTPVREALRRLEQDDLVESRGKTIVVVGVTHQDLLDMLEIRLRLEGLATAMCCQRIGQKELVELDEIVTLQEFYVSRDLPDKILESDSRFHTAIYAACGSRVFDKQLTGLLKRLMRHRKLSVSDNQRAQKSTAEHRAIFNALAAGDAAQVEALATQHVERGQGQYPHQRAGGGNLNFSGGHWPPLFLEVPLLSRGLRTHTLIFWEGGRPHTPKDLGLSGPDLGCFLCGQEGRAGYDTDDVSWATVTSIRLHQREESAGRYVL